MSSTASSYGASELSAVISYIGTDNTWYQINSQLFNISNVFINLINMTDYIPLNRLFSNISKDIDV